MGNVERKFYYYDINLFDLDDTSNTLVEVKNQKQRFEEMFHYIYEINKKISKEKDDVKKRKLQKQIEFSTSDGDKLYVIVDKINEDNIRYRLILCRSNALPLVEKNGILSFLTEYLPKDFSLAEITHCVIFQNDGILGAEFNYAGARPSYITEYLMAGIRKIPYVTCKPKINSEAFKRIVDEKPFGYFVLSVKNTPEMRSVLAQKNNLFSALLSNISNVDEYELCLKRRITKKKEGFEAPLTKSEMEEFVKTYKDFIGTFKVSQGAKKDAIDLISDKFVCKSDFVQTKNKTIESDEAYGVIVSFFGSVIKNYKPGD
jgi:hypothetical protein